MIDTQLTRKSDGTAHVVSGYCAGEYTVAPVEFGPPVGLHYGALIEEFDVTGDLASSKLTLEEEHARGWAALAAANHATATGANRAEAVVPPTVEEIFESIEQEAGDEG
jgi:hypothetical protein